MAELKAHLPKLHKNLNLLREREAKYGGNAPLELLNQIDDHKEVITLTEQAIRGEKSEAEWREALKPLLVSLNVFGEFFGPSIPLQYPARAEYFTNRKRELNNLLASLQPGQVVTLCGPGGIGKSALAAETLYQLMPDPNQPPACFPDGVIYHSFYGRPDPALALEHIVRSFDETAQDTTASAAFRLLANKQALILLDGAEEVDNLAAVLDVRGWCGVIVTSRSRKRAGAERQDIAPLKRNEAVKLLRAWGKRQVNTSVAARRICDLVGGLPLAIRLAGRYLSESSETASEYLEWLETTPLQALDQGQRQEESVPLLLRRSLAQVSEAARQVLAVTSGLALAPFAREVIATAWPKVKVGPALGELVNYGLLRRSSQRYEVSHALIHTYAREQMKLEAQATVRVVTYYTQLTKEQGKRGLEGYRQLDGERSHLLRVLAECAEREEWQAASNLVGVMTNYLYIQGYITEWVTTLEIGVTAAQKLGNRYNEGACLGQLGNAYSILGQVAQAIKYYQQALVIDREIGDWRGEAADLSNLGGAYSTLGQVAQAIEHYQQALVIHREIGDRQGEATALGNLGIAYRDLGQVAQAIEHYQEALVIHREIGYRQGEATDLGNLGVAYRDLSQVAQAKEYMRQSLAIFEEIKSPNVAFVQNWLAQLEE